MAQFEDGSYQSTPGPALIAKVLAGRCKMNYSRAAVGAGTIPEGETPKTMREPPGYVMDATISAVTNPVDGECQVTVQINSSDVEEGFYVTCVLLYADDPDEGQVPFTYLRLEDGPEWIRPASSAVGKLATFDLIAAVGAVDSVTANIDPNSIVTRAEAQRLIAAATARLEITVPKDGWTSEAEDEEGDSNPEEIFGGLHVDIPIDGVTEVMVPFLFIHPAYLDAARACEISPTSKTIAGALRVYAREAPSQDIGATLTLLCASTGSVSSEASPDGAYVLPAATTTRLGGVKVGGGLTVTPDGTLSVDNSSVVEEISATEEEAAEAIADALNGGE